MRHNLALLKADVREELTKLELLRKEFQAALSRVDLRLPEPIPNYDRAAIGYLLHGFYNGCENIFRGIARFFENDLDNQTWNRDLLRRMALAVAGYRPAVIDEELYRLLDDFRAFRYKFRHSYSFELDWDRERAVAMKLERAAALLQVQIGDFLTRLEEVDAP